MADEIEGLYGPDDAATSFEFLLDDLPLEQDPTYLAAGIGLRLWFASATIAKEPKKYRRLLKHHRKALTSLPAVVQSSLEKIAADPAAAAAAPGSRPRELRELLGDGCNGPRHDELLTFWGASVVIADLAKLCRADLNDAFSRAEELYELCGEMSPLGMLLELGSLAPPIPAHELAAWRSSLDRIDQNTTGDRDEWDTCVVDRVGKILALLASRTG